MAKVKSLSRKKDKSWPFLAVSLTCGALVIVLNIYGFFLLRQRSGLPPEIKVKNLIQIDNIQIQRTKDIEFILSQKQIGDKAQFLIKAENGHIEKKETLIIPYYSQFAFPVIYLLIGIFCLVIGFLVLLLRFQEIKARIFYWSSLAFSSSLIISGGFHCLRQEWSSYLPGILFYISYPLAPALLLHFSFIISSRKKIKYVFLTYFPAMLFVLALETTFLWASLKSSIEIYRIYQSIIYIFRYYVVILVLAAVINLINYYRKAFLEVERAQIKWLLYGLIVGLGPFILFYQLPRVLKVNPLLSEEFSSIFFIFIPVTFALAIIKYRLMNIELIINRSLVYGALTIFTVGIYLFSVEILQVIIARFFNIQRTALSAAAALAAAAAFHPARRKIQELVDKSFYRVSYDYRRTIIDFNNKAQRMIKPDHLADFFLTKLNRVLPLEKISLSLYSAATKPPSLILYRDEGGEEGQKTSLFLNKKQIMARKKAVRIEEDLDFSQEDWLQAEGLELIIPLVFKSTNLAGLLCLGRKKSSQKFSREDLELLRAMTNELVLNLERIKLQEDIIYERAEKEKLDELNRLKTEFIATVSHELRTPMTSIRGMTEMLSDGKVKDRLRQEELLKLMAGETRRLSRLLHNILDFGRIEQKTKKYKFQKAEVKSIIEEEVKIFQNKLEKENFIMRTFLPANPVFLNLDVDALRQALTNLIDNAIKYSTDTREIEIELVDMKEEVEIQIRDKGIGIPLEDQAKIFEKFYRHPEACHFQPQGVGLGLKIVKHIMEAHQGEIRVESQPGRGSTFSLIFPKP